MRHKKCNFIFYRAIRQKSMHIQLLMQDLTESEMQYALAFRSQVESMSAVQSIHSRRVNGLLVEHEACVAEFTRRREPTDRQTHMQS